MIFALSNHPDEVKAPLLVASTEVLFEAGTGRGRISWKSSFSCRVPGFQDEGHPPWGLGLRGPAPARGLPLPPARSRAPLLGNHPLTQVAAPEPCGERAHTPGLRAARAAPTSDPPLSSVPVGPGGRPSPAPLGGQPVEPTNQRDRHIARPGAGQPIAARV